MNRADLKLARFVIKKSLGIKKLANFRNTFNENCVSFVLKKQNFSKNSVKYTRKPNVYVKSNNTSLEKTASNSISLFEADTKMYLYPHLTPTQLPLPQSI